MEYETNNVDLIY